MHMKYDFRYNLKKIKFETISIEQVKHEFDSSGKSFYGDVCDYFVSIDKTQGHFSCTTFKVR